ncbi:class II fumarate hydratase [Pseudokordiimonas caeni]|uniref:class II fumarate hydratase n=1 Tax=Pseudokordiimonas caeni TaxID=2997908 RepID=UPI002810DEAC|nr:class II fumarate hydratase [Pseudokordiimonas caeni]
MTRAPLTRTEKDSLGEIEVPADRYWGAQTERCLRNFPIGRETLSPVFWRALGLIKLAAASVNKARGALDAKLADAIEVAANEVAEGKLNDHFPLPVWQSGSGTQFNMNANEVIAGHANELLTKKRGGTSPVHPNDHVNMGQSSNDTIPTAMDLSALLMWHEATRPALERLIAATDAKAEAFRDLVKVGRTHLMDAVPMTLGAEFAAFAGQMRAALWSLDDAFEGLLDLPQGGTAVGSGLNAPADFGEKVAAELAALTGLSLTSAPNKYVKMAAHHDLFMASAALSGLATVLHKYANDVRMLGSGPRAGLMELALPKNEPGSSIMAGKVNPSQAEAMVMVCARVFGNHTVITHTAAGGQFQLNANNPVMADALLQSLQLLADMMDSFRERCIEGLKANEARLEELTARTLMVATSLVPVIGYDATAKLVFEAEKQNAPLRDVALASGVIDAETYDKHVDPGKMARG